MKLKHSVFREKGIQVSENGEAGIQAHQGPGWRASHKGLAGAVA